MKTQTKEQRRLDFVNKQRALNGKAPVEEVRPMSRLEQAERSVRNAARIRAILHAGKKVTWNALPVSKARSKGGMLRVLVQGQWMILKPTDSVTIG